MRKFRAFTIIELIVAMSLMSIIISFLFVTLRNLVFIQTHIKKEIPKILECEKAYVFLSDLLFRSVIDHKHEIKIENNRLISFYYLPSGSDCESLVSLFFAELSNETQGLKLKIFSIKNEKKELMQELIILSSLSNFVIKKTQDPQAIFIDFIFNAKKTQWTFILDPNIQSDKTA